MKRIIALTSLVFLLLTALLPAGATKAANNAAVQMTGITFELRGGGEINAVGDGSHFVMNLVGDYEYGEQIVDRIVVTSDSAVTVSVLPQNFDYSQLPFPLTKDEFDLQFVNGEAEITPEKLYNWANRISMAMGQGPIPAEEAPDYVFTLNELKSFYLPLFSGFALEYFGLEFSSPYVFPGFLVDQAGNESPASFTIETFGWVLIDGEVYYIDEDGSYVVGWLQVEDGTWYYLDPETAAMVTGWKKIGGKWYFFAPDGAMKTGWIKPNPKGPWYYLNPNGDMATGWIKLNNKWYYLNPTSGAMVTGLVKSNGKAYILGQSGAMLTGNGWVKDGNKWYYITGETAKTGWLFSNKCWYYLNPVTGEMMTGWIIVNNKWYYLYKNGCMAANTRIGTYWVGKDGAWIPNR